MTEGEKEKYTRRQAGKELAAIEQHLRGFDSDRPDFCMECIGKHCLHLSELADEGKTFFPKDSEFWASIGKWADDLMDMGEDGKVHTYDIAMRLAEEARELRKELQKRYMGGMGKCRCVTGFEECCPHSKRV